MGLETFVSSHLVIRSGAALVNLAQNPSSDGSLLPLQKAIVLLLQLNTIVILRRLITRGLAIIPAMIGIAILGETGVGKLLVLSQVILSLQLPFAVFPLVLLTSSPAYMGQFTNPRWVSVLAWGVGGLIAGLNIWLLGQLWLEKSG